MTNTRFKNHWFVIWYSYRLAWLHFAATLETLSQKDDLERLVRWAHRKKLQGVREHYLRRLEDVEMRLLDKAIRYPHLTRLADLAHCALVILNPPPPQYTKGAASKYRLRN